MAAQASRHSAPISSPATQIAFVFKLPITMTVEHHAADSAFGGPSDRP